MERAEYPVFEAKGTNVRILPMSVPEKWNWETKKRVEPYELVEMAMNLCRIVPSQERERQLELIGKIIRDQGKTQNFSFNAEHNKCVRCEQLEKERRKVNCMNDPNIIYTGQSKPDIIITQHCKWCDGEDHIIAKDDYVILGMGGNYLFANGDDAVSVEINFCPMCGRQLNA